MVVAGRSVVPGQVYRVGVQHLSGGLSMGGEGRAPLTMKAALIRDGRQVAGGKRKVEEGQIDNILLRVSTFQ